MLLYLLQRNFMISQLKQCTQQERYHKRSSKMSMRHQKNLFDKKTVKIRVIFLNGI